MRFCIKIILIKFVLNKNNIYICRKLNQNNIEMIGIKIRKLRAERKLTQEELAQELEISQSTLCRIESGETKKINMTILQKICTFFDVPISFFYDDKTQKG